MALYQLTLMYRNLSDAQSDVRRAKERVQSIAGSQWRVLSAGVHTCAIGLVTDAPEEELLDCFEGCGTEHLDFLLVEIAAAPAGYLSKEAWQWLDSHLPGR